ncbi:unnamed protein product, partial [Prunus brigantina]
IVFLLSSSSSLNLNNKLREKAFIARKSKDSASKKNGGKEVGMVTPQEKSSKKMKFVSSSAETEPITSTTTISDDSKSGRGMSTMPRVVKRKLHKIKPIVEVPLVDKKWAEIPKDIKEHIWEAVDMAFVVGQGGKNSVLTSAAKKWKDFKSTLTRHYILPYINDRERLSQPPETYKFIEKAQWDAFVASRLGRNLSTIIDCLEKDMLDDLQKQVSEGKVSVSGSNDVLTMALGPEHPGRVRGVTEGVDYSNTEVPSSLKSLCSYVETTLVPKEQIINFTIEKEVFGADRNTFVLPEDITQIAGMEEIGATVVAVYMRCLYEQLKKANMCSMVGFIDPAAVSANAGTITSRSRIVAGRLQKTDGEQIFMMPYNPGRHWVLLIIRAKRETVYFLDPLPGIRVVDEETKDIVNSAIKIYNSHIARQGRKAPIWKTLSGTSKQPSSVECGYYVMRFMRDIIMDPSLAFEKTFAKGKEEAPYPQEAIDEVRNEWAEDHLYFNEVDQSYKNWTFHGEPWEATTNASRNVEEDDGHSRYSFVSEEIDMDDNDFGDFGSDPYEFANVIGDGDQPVYPGCRKYTKLSALVKLYNLKAKHGMSDVCFTELLILQGDLLPEGNTVPTSMYEAKKTLCALGLSYEKMHACPNDCILYRKEYEDSTNCPTCGISRWKEGKDSILKEGVPAKVVWYFPPIPRFKRMFQSHETAKSLTWHAARKSIDGQMSHPADSPSWKLLDDKWPEFGNEPRNLRLALSSDGFNPHSSLNVYLEPLIDDLKSLWDGIRGVYDAHNGEYFTLRAALMWTINDFPAYGNLSGCVVKGYKACPICGDDTPSHRLKNGHKICYIGHRKWLPINHPYRRQRAAFNGKPEYGTPPEPLTGEEVLHMVEDGNRVCWKKKSIFFDLEYWKYLPVRHALDVMHIEKNVCDSIIGTLLEIPGKNKDGIAARLDLLNMGVKTDLQPEYGERRTRLPPGPWNLSRAEKREVCNSFYGMKVPEGYSSNIKKLVSLQDSRLLGLKSHDCHTLMQQLLPVAIRSVLEKPARYAITRLCFFFNAICAKTVDVSNLDKLEEDVVVTLCLLEKYFPPSFFDIMVHLVVHLVREVLLCGPVYFRWMYPFERYMKVLKGYVQNRTRSEGCIAERYIAEEAVEFCTEYLSDVSTVGVPSSQKMGVSKPLSSCTVSVVDRDLLDQAHLYVLENTEEVLPYIEYV